MRKAAHNRQWKRIIVTGVIGPWLLPAATWAADPEPIAAPRQPAAMSSQAPRALTLDECRDLALEKQPALAAQRASLASAEASARALDKLSFTSLVRRDLPIRKHQAALGVAIAAAGVDRAERDTVYAVTRTYFGVVYARRQRVVADQAITRLRTARESAARLVAVGDPSLQQMDVDRTDVNIALLDARVQETVRGEALALAALREAIGLEPGCAVDVPDQELPDVIPQICREQIVALAVERRPELRQAGDLAEVTALEVNAQSRSLALTSRTFASATDLHANPIPPGLMDGDYRPAAVGPEMPTNLVGCRKDRVERALALSGRATAVVDKTRNLIVLEAEEAFLKWREAANQIPKLREAARLGDKLHRGEEDRFEIKHDAYRTVLEAIGLTSLAKVNLNQALYHHALALTSLERVTAGGFFPVFAKEAPAKP